MPINYTTLLGLAKPVTGTEANAWGDVVNDQITSLVEDAIANAVSISVSAGNVTLSDTDGATDQARMAVLLITGSPGTSRNIVAPSRSKWYIVRNGSDSSVVVKGSATTGVTIASGKTAMVFWNGSDFQTVASNNVDLTTEVTGTLPVANGGTGVTSSTGTGSVVLSTSPTLTTPTLGVASATSVAAAAGAVGTPSFTATGDLNTGMWFPAADTLAWSTDGVERVRIDSSGNVGIGVTPSAATLRTLQIDQASTITSPTDEIYISQNAVYDGAWKYIVSGSRATQYSQRQSIGAHVWSGAASGTAGSAITFSELMRLDSSGNLGIGTNSPSAKLHVSGSTDRVAFFNSTNDTEIAFATNNAVKATIYTDFTSGGFYPDSAGIVLRNYTYGNGGVKFILSNSFGTPTERFNITEDGVMYCGGVYNTTVGATNRDVYVDNGGVVGYLTSIRASKINIANLSDVNWLYQLNPVTFNYRKKDKGTYTDEADGPVQFGLIAEDVETVKPELCFYDVLEGGGTELKGVSYSSLVTPLLKAVQQLKDELEVAKTRIAALEQK